MELSLEQYERIHQYLDDKMTPEQEKQFMHEVGRSELLQEFLQFEVELRQNLRLIADKKKTNKNDFKDEKQFDDASDIRSLVERAGNEWQKENNTRSAFSSASAKKIKEKKRAKAISLHWFWIAAAAFVVFAVAGITWFIINKTAPNSIATTNKRVDSAGKKQDNKSEIATGSYKDSLRKQEVNFAALFKKFYKRDNTPERKPVLLAEALIDYDNEDYKALQNINLADLPITRGPAGDDIESYQNVQELGHYYKGLSFIPSRNDKQALDNLQWVTDNAINKQLIVKAQWYLALIYIKKSDTSKAIPLLTSVANNTSTPYSRRAKELLELLKP